MFSTLSIEKDLHQSGQLLCSIRVPEVDPPAGAAEGCGGEQRPIRREVTGRLEVQSLTGPSRQVPHERVRPQAPKARHLIKADNTQVVNSLSGSKEFLRKYLQEDRLGHAAKCAKCD